MKLFTLGRFKLWYNSFFQIAMAMPFLLVLSSAHYSATTLIVISLGIVLNYLYTSAVNYISDIEEDSLKPKLGRKWNKMEDPPNPLVESDSNLKPILNSVVLAYTLLTVIVISLAFMYIPDPIIYIVHMLVLLTVGTLYSIGPRLKESMIGFFIASMLYWYPPVIIMTSLGIYDTIILVYTVTIFLLGLYESIKHTVEHYLIDSGAGKRTFVMIIGRKLARKMTGILGFLFYTSTIILGYFLHPALLAIGCLALLGFWVTGNRFWRLYYDSVFIFLGFLILTGANLGSDYAAAFALILGLPVFTTPREGIALFRGSIYSPLRGLTIKSYHIIYNRIHKLVKGY